MQARQPSQLPRDRGASMVLVQSFSEELKRRPAE
jgi:hypothetical protein